MHQSTRKLKREEDPNEIARWQAFREFTAYSASEMESGALDSWLTDEEGDPPPPPKIGDGSYKIDIDALGFRERRGWLASFTMRNQLYLSGPNQNQELKISHRCLQSALSQIILHFYLSRYLPIEKEDLEIHWLTYRRRESVPKHRSLCLNADLESASAVIKRSRIVPRKVRMGLLTRITTKL